MKLVAMQYLFIWLCTYYLGDFLCVYYTRGHTESATTEVT